MTQDDTNETEPTSGFDPLSTTEKESMQIVYRGIRFMHFLKQSILALQTCYLMKSGELDTGAGQYGLGT